MIRICSTTLGCKDALRLPQRASVQEEKGLTVLSSPMISNAGSYD